MLGKSSRRQWEKSVRARRQNVLGKAIVECLEPRQLLTAVSVTSVTLNGNDLPNLSGEQRSMVDSLVYGFSEPVNIASSGAFAITVHSGEIGTVPTLTWNAISPAVDGSSSQWAVTFSGLGVTGNSIANGVYDAAVDGSLITSDANPSITCDAHATDTFFRLFGDINGDEVVNAADNLRFSHAINGSYMPAFDSNDDGVINAADNLKFAHDLSVGFAGDDFTQTISSPTVPTQLAFSVHSLSTTEGTVINPGITVKVEDASGNLATGDTSSIALSISSGTLHGTLTQSAVGGVATFGDLSISAAGLYTLTASDGALTNDMLSSLNIAPAAPMDLTALSTSPTEIDLAWTNNSTSATSIEIDGSTDGVTFTPITTTLSPSATTFANMGLSEGTHYFYQVTAKYGSLSSASMPVDTFAEPAAPSGLSVSMVDGQAVLSWTNNSVDSPAFFIEESIDGSDFNVIDETDPGTTTYTDVYPEDGTTYYRVDALNGDGTAASVSSSASVVSAITPPSDLSAEAVSASEVDLEWTNNSADATGSAILRSTNGGSFAAVATLSDPTVDSYEDTGLSAGNNYAYEVEATQGSSTSAASDPANDTTTPPTPGGLTIAVGPQTGGGQNSELDLSWNPASGSAGYDIQREATGGTWDDIAEVSGGATVHYNDTGLWDGVTYSYQVSAFNDAGDSDFSSTATLATPVTLPIAPTDLYAVATVPGTIQMVWQNNAYNETGFVIETSSSGSDGTWSPLNVDGTSGVTTAAGTTTYTDSGLAPSTTRYYEVMAHNATGNSSAITASATTSSHAVIPPPPAAPTILSITTEEGSQIITYQMNNSPEPEVYYALERSYDGNTGEIPAGPLGTPGDDSTSSFQVSADFGINFTYRVIAHGAGGDTASSTMSATLPLLLPTTDVDQPDFYTQLDGSISIHMNMDPPTYGDDPQHRPDTFHTEFWAVDGNGTPITDLGGVGGTRDNPYATMAALPPSEYGYAAITTLHNDAGYSTPNRYPLASIGAQTTYGNPSLSIDDGTPTLSDGVTEPTFECSTDGNSWFDSPGAGFYVAPGVSAMIRAYGEDDEGNTTGYSNEVDVSADPSPAPTGLTATATGTGTIHLAWSEIPQLDPESPAVGIGGLTQTILIERSDNGGAFHEVGYADPDSTNIDMQVPIEGMTYAFRLRVKSQAGNSIVPLAGYSPYSAAATAQAYASNPSKTFWPLSTSTATTLHAVWIDHSEGETGYELQLAQTGDYEEYSAGAVIQTVTVGPDTTSYDFTGLTPGTSYVVWARSLPTDDVPATYVVATSLATTALPTISVSTILNAEETSPDGNASDGYFQFTRTGDVSQPLAVTYTVDTSADDAAFAGHEYRMLSSPVTFAIGQSTVLVPVVPNEINQVEENKTVTVKIASSDDYTTSTSYGSATLTIANMDNVTITVPSDTLDLGIPEDIWISVVGSNGRPFADTLDLTSSDPTDLALAETTVTCAADGTAPATATTKPTNGTPRLTAKDAKQNTGAANQTVSQPSPWVRVGTWKITTATARSGEGCTLDGLAFLVTGQQSDWNVLKVKGITDGTTALKPGVVVDVTPLLKTYDTRLRQNVLAVTNAFAVSVFGFPTHIGKSQTTEDYINSFFTAGTLDTSDCQNAAITCLQEGLIKTLYPGEADVLDIRTRDVGDLGFPSLITQSKTYVQGDWTWINNATGVTGAWQHENLICLDANFNHAATNYWGFTGHPATGNFAFWRGVMRKNQPWTPPHLIDGMSQVYKFWNVPLICQKLFDYRESQGQPS